MNAITKTSYGVAGIVLSSMAHLSALANSPAWWAFGQDKVTVQWESAPLDVAIQRYVNNFMIFLSLIAVLYALYWGFLILTAGGEDDKVTKWKTILIQWAIWLFVIWLAGTIVKWVLWLLA